MTHHERRLRTVEARLTVHENGVAWADVHLALMRQQARARLTICQRLDVDPNDPRVMDAMTWLVGDDPLRVSQDMETIAQWRRAQGIPADTGEARQRVTTRLEAMARRLQTEKA